MIKQLLMTAILIVLTALFAKAQLQLPITEAQQIHKVTISTLVAQQKEAAKQAHKKLRKHFFVQQNSTQGGQKNNNWKLHGIVKTGVHYFALIKQQAKLARCELGDTLIDYGTITAIHANGISVRTDAQTREYRLYQERDLDKK